jgi:indolepyruvate decarboxylase
MAVQQAHALVHHTLGNGEFDLFYKMTDPVVCAKAILTPDNCTTELERVLDAALYHRRPVYIAIPKNYADMPVTDMPVSLPSHSSDPEALQAAIEDILKTLSTAKSACVLPGIFLNRYGLHKKAAEVIAALGLPFATMMMDKSTLDESLPNYIGMYTGKLTNPPVRKFIESCDCIFVIDAMFTDINSGAFTARIDPEKSIDVMHHHVRVGNRIYRNVEIKDVLDSLIKHLSSRKEIQAPREHGLGSPEGARKDLITENYLYPRFEQFFKPDDIIVAETGSCSMGLIHAQLPEGATFHNQTLWGSIGWATPAALGAALAAPHRRTILFTGEGSHQMTAQEVGQFSRYGAKTIIFLLNNKGFLIERQLSKDPEIEYNDVTGWNDTKLPEALGCKGWYTAKVSTCGELDDAMKFVQDSDCSAYIEIVTEKYVSPLFLERLCAEI